MALTERYVKATTEFAAWANATGYVVGNVVLGSTGYAYVCIDAHTSETGVKGRPTDGTDHAVYWEACDGTINEPWTLIQGFAAAVAGDRVNIKKGSYSLASSPTISTAGSVGSPLVFRGYNSTIGDLESVGRTNGNGPLIVTDFPEINCGANRLAFSGARQLIQNLHIYGTSGDRQVDFGAQGSAMVACKVVCTNTGSNANAMNVNTNARVIGCDIQDKATGRPCLRTFPGDAAIIGCRVLSESHNAIGMAVDNGPCLIIGNLLLAPNGTGIDLTSITNASRVVHILNNTIYSCGTGIMLPNAASGGNITVLNNHITDCSGYAIDSAHKATAVQHVLLMNNRTRDNTSGATDGIGDCPLINHVTTDAGDKDTDFVNAAGGDFNLIMTAAGRGKAILPYQDIGAMQRNVRASDLGLTADILKSGEVVDDVTGTLSGGGGSSPRIASMNGGLS